MIAFGVVQIAQVGLYGTIETKALVQDKHTDVAETHTQEELILNPCCFKMVTRANICTSSSLFLFPVASYYVLGCSPGPWYTETRNHVPARNYHSGN